MPDSNDYPRIQFNASECIDQIYERTPKGHSEHLQARRDLRRYYKMLRAVRPTFTPDEAHLIVDVLNGVWFELTYDTTQHLIIAFEDAEDAYYEKWEVDRDAFLARLRSMSYAEALSIIDAAERFWNAQDRTVADVGLCDWSEETNGKA